MQDPSLQKVVDTCHSIVTHFSRKTTLSDALDGLQRAKGRAPLTLVGDVETRWTGRFDMMVRVFELRSFIVAALGDTGEAEDTSFVAKFNKIRGDLPVAIEVLRYPKQLSDEMESSKATLSQLIRVVDSLQKKLEVLHLHCHPYVIVELLTCFGALVVVVQREPADVVSVAAVDHLAAATDGRLRSEGENNDTLTSKRLKWVDNVQKVLLVGLGSKTDARKMSSAHVKANVLTVKSMLVDPRFKDALWTSDDPGKPERIARDVLKTAKRELVAEAVALASKRGAFGGLFQSLCMFLFPAISPVCNCRNTAAAACGFTKRTTSFHSVRQPSELDQPCSTTRDTRSGDGRRSLVGGRNGHFG